MANFSRHILGALLFVLNFYYNHTKTTTEKAPDILQWSWDSWCQLQPKVGNCNNPHKYFYYDTQTDACREFTFSGCNGNENKFYTRMDCEQFCKGFGLVVALKTRTLSEICSLQPNPGTCISNVPHFYYDVNVHKCKQFVFGGCGGNANRFSTEEDCMEKCGAAGLRTSKNRKKKHH